MCVSRKLMGTSISQPYIFFLSLLYMFIKQERKSLQDDLCFLMSAVSDHLANGQVRTQLQDRLKQFSTNVLFSAFLRGSTVAI